MINLLRRTVSDQLCLEAFLRRGRRYGLYPVDQPTIVQLIEEADETLFNNIRDTIHFTFSTNTNFRPIPDPTQPNPRVIPTGQPTDKCLKCLLLYRLKPPCEYCTVTYISSCCFTFAALNCAAPVFIS